MFLGKNGSDDSRSRAGRNIIMDSLHVLSAGAQ